MSTYPTLAEAEATSDRAWDAMNHNARYCAALLLSGGMEEYAKHEARNVEARREWWHETSQQLRELRRAERTATMAQG